MDILVITFNQDAYGGEAARAETWVNGKMVGLADIMALHKDGTAQAVVFQGDFGTGPKSVSVFFKNDAWGGSAATDRNLYVTGMTYNGRYLPMPIVPLMSGTSRFDYVIPGDAVAAAARGTPTLLINDWTKMKTTSTGSKDSWSNSMPPGANRTLNVGTEDQWYTDPTIGQYNPFSFNAAKNLIITAKPSKDTGGNYANYTYNSGCLSSDGFFQQTFGYFSFKGMLCGGAGWWPAFWMLPSKNNFQYTCEADVMESWQGDQSYVQQTLIGPQAGMSEWPHRNVRPLVPGGAQNGFHTYGMEWRKDKTKFFLDDVQTGEFDTPPPMQGDSPMYLLIDLAVGKPGSWVGSPTPGAVGTLTVAEIAAYA